MQATQTLPPGYRKLGTLDVSANQRLLLILNLIGLLIIGFSGWLFFRALLAVRPGDTARILQQVQKFTIAGTVELIAAIVALTIVYVILHEAIHGIFFWLFTRSRPLFAFRWSYAYAAAPDWYIPRNAFFITTLAPLVLITLAGLVLFYLVPAAWLAPIWYIIMMNAGGAVGDLAVAGWLLGQSSACLAQDRGDAVTLYVPVQEAGHLFDEG
jgi:hypothetical protein